MRTLNECYIILKSSFEYGGMSFLCNVATHICYRKKITPDEHKALMSHMAKHRPRTRRIDSAWWEDNQRDERIKFLNRMIKITNL